MYEMGTILVSESETGNKNVFIFNGTITGDGYGCVLGMLDNDKQNIAHSSGYRNWCKGGPVRKATEEEIKMFFNKIHNQDVIKQY